MKMNKSAYLFAAALVASTMGMTSCSNEVVPEVENNPTFDGESVKTQFALNIPAAKGTRMSDANTQQNGKPFLGMQNIKLLPLKYEATDNKALLQIISLDDIANTGDLNANRKFYSDVNIPVGTSNFLFYGEANGSVNGADVTDENYETTFARGVLKNTLGEAATNNTDKISFSLVPITSLNGFASATEDGGSAKAIIDALTAVAGAEGWKAYADTDGDKSETLTKLYNGLTSLKAGSANSVKLVLQDLQAELKKIDVSGGGDVSNIVTAINNELNTYIGSDGVSGSLASNTYPQDFRLPDGAVQLTWSEGTDIPSYKEDGAVVGSVTLKPDSICYPASLSYFVSTGLKQTSDVKPVWPTDLSNWDSWTTTGGSWTNGPVAATTTAIGLTEPIQYAVANLKTTVKCKTAVLEDNATADFAGEKAPRKIIVPSTGFQVTGILVGGQPKSVKWNFQPSSDEADDRARMVYDNDVKNVYAKVGAGDPNYTLVLDNRKSGAGAAKDKIYIAVEFKNNSGADFYGADGLVKDGATFYMVAQLDPDAATTDNGRTSVFEQDYTTVANLTISSLEHAYNCIPDLRSTQLSLGLAVDLTWQDGIIFDVDFE